MNDTRFLHRKVFTDAHECTDMDIVPIHYRTEQGSPINRCEVETFEDVNRVIIDEFEKKKIIDVADDGTVSCRTCDGDCGHETKIRERLHSITDNEYEDGDAEGDTEAEFLDETETEPVTADD